MNDALQLFGTGAAAWRGMGRAQQLLLLTLVVLLPIVIFVGSQWLWDGQYVPLFAGLGPEDSGAILTHLKATKIPYRMQGELIMVPADKVDELRLRLATQGLPLGGGLGFELFDKTTFGVSDFQQRLNYQRALQGELARTIGQLRGVSRARVHLVLPQPSVFADRDRAASASVFLKLSPSARLSSEEVRGIVHLVASSVESLSPDRVTVVDTAGRVLSVGGDAGAGGLSPRRIEIKTAVEEGLERRVQSLLDSALGPGKAVTRVSAQLNFDQVERTEERFDPNPVPRQESRTVETTKGASSTPTLTVVPPATPGAPTPPPPPPSTTSNDGNRESESVTYEISRIVARTLTTPGEIQRLSVAVVLSTNSKVTQGPDQKELREPAPRSPEEIEKIRRVVMGAVGASQARQDEVTVVEMPFDTASLERERTLLDQQGGTFFSRPLINNQVVGLAAVIVFGALAYLWLTRRPSRPHSLPEVAISMKDHGAGRPAEAVAGRGLAAELRAGSSAGTGESAPMLPEEFVRASKQREEVRQKAYGLANSEPETAAQLLKAWVARKKPMQPLAGGSDAR